MPAQAEAPLPGLTAFGVPGVMVLPGAYDAKLSLAASQALSPKLEDELKEALTSFSKSFA